MPTVPDRKEDVGTRVTQFNEQHRQPPTPQGKIVVASLGFLTMLSFEIAEEAGKPVEGLEDFLEFTEFFCRATLVTALFAFVYDLAHAFKKGQIKAFLAISVKSEGLQNAGRRQSVVDLQREIADKQAAERLSARNKIKAILMIVAFVCVLSLQLAALLGSEETAAGLARFLHIMEFVCSAFVVVAVLALGYDICEGLLHWYSGIDERGAKIKEMLRNIFLCNFTESLRDPEDEIAGKAPHVHSTKTLLCWMSFLFMFSLEVSVKLTAEEDAGCGEAAIDDECEPVLPSALQWVPTFVESLEALCVSGFIVAFAANANDFVAVLLRGKLLQLMSPNNGDPGQETKPVAKREAPAPTKTLLCALVLVVLIVMEGLEEAGQTVAAMEDLLHWVEFFCKSGLFVTLTGFAYDIIVAACNGRTHQHFYELLPNVEAIPVKKARAVTTGQDVDDFGDIEMDPIDRDGAGAGGGGGGGRPAQSRKGGASSLIMDAETGDDVECVSGGANHLSATGKRNLRLKIFLVVVAFYVILAFQVIAFTVGESSGLDRFFHFVEFICASLILVGFVAVVHDVSIGLVLYIQSPRQNRDARDQAISQLRKIAFCDTDDPTDDDRGEQGRRRPAQRDDVRIAVMWAAFVFMLVVEIVAHVSRVTPDGCDDGGDSSSIGASNSGDCEPELSNDMLWLKYFRDSLESLCISGFLVAFLMNATRLFKTLAHVHTSKRGGGTINDTANDTANDTTNDTTNDAMKGPAHRTSAQRPDRLGSNGGSFGALAERPVIETGDDHVNDHDVAFYDHDHDHDSSDGDNDFGLAERAVVIEC